jgi:dipeptidyl aminopeptidase/acylaminoacyl peptidase
MAAAAVALVLLSFTEPGQAVIDSVRDSIGRVEVRHAARPALDRLPAAGSLLVQSPEGPWVVREDGSKRLLGPYLDATWSPMGRFVGVTRENALLAVEPGGRVHWSLGRPRVTRPRWAPSGFRVAYLSGPTVRVVAGDGTGDRPIGPGVAAEWRPGLTGGVTVVGGQKVLAGQNVLAVATPGGRVRALDVDTSRTLWSSPRVGGQVRTMSWSIGSGLLVATRRALVVLDGIGRVARRVATPPGTVITGAAFAPSGDGIAVVRRRGTVSELALVEGRRERLLFAGAGRLGGVTWSPDGRWLLVAWPSADQFLFVRTTGPPRVEAAQGVAGEFDPRAVGAAGDPRPAGWCCSG